ncbi:rab11 family-interacting protein 1 [Mantella aurantiaca]
MALAQQSQTWFPTHVQVTVLQAKGLRSKGKAGTNDAYSIIQLGKEKYSTTVAEKSLAPVWKEEATFEVPLLHNDNQERCTVRVIVMHRALVGMDKFLGQLDLNLWELHQARNRRKVQWYPLKSKHGKKEKERGQIEVEVQFMRNNMTASMFDLSMKDKSRSTFGKLKDKLKGKRQDGLPDTASAIVPSMNEYSDESDIEMPEAEKKKSKLKTLFSKQGLKKNSLSQSMSVLPTLPPSPSQRTVLKPGDFSSDFHKASGSPVSERRFPHIPIISHKRTASADTKQWNQITSGNKKDGLSLFSGLKSKNDPITRSNLCINGNHVYMEDAEPKSDSSKESSVTNSPQIIRKSPHYASAENMSFKPSNETVNTSTSNERELTSSTSNSSLKSFEQPAIQAPQVEEPRSKSPPLTSDVPKEAKENKKQENKKSSLLSLVTGRKEAPKPVETPKPAEVETFTDVSLKKEGPKVASSQRPTEVTNKKATLNPFEEDMVEEKKPEPLPSERNAKTSAVKPRLDVSSEAETKARLSSESLSDHTSFFAASFSGGQDTSPKPGVTTFSSAYSPHSLDKGSVLPQSPTAVKNGSTNEGSTDTSDNEKPSLPLFWRSGNSSNKPSDPKEVNVVTPFTEKKGKKTYVMSLLDQIKGKSTSKNEENVVDEDLVKGIFPVNQTLSMYDDPESFPENDIHTEGGASAGNQKVAAKINQPVLPEESEDKSSTSVKDMPKPTPRVQSASNKEKSEEEKVVAPKPAPRSGKLNKTSDSGSSIPTSTLDQPTERSMPEAIMEQVSRVGASPVDGHVHPGNAVANIKMTSPLIEEYSYRLEELPVIPENPEVASDDEQLDAKSEQSLVESGTKTCDESGSAKHQINNEGLYSSENAKDIPSDITNSKVKAEVEISDSVPQHAPEISASNTFPSSSFNAVSLPNDNTNTSSTESPANPAIDVSDKVESAGKKKLLRAWVSPSETHPIPTVQNGGAVSSRQRTNPVKPMNATQSKSVSNFSQPIKSHETALNSINTKKYDPSDPASAYAQLTHDELIQVVLKQKDIITKKESQVRELEDYIDNLLVRVIEETPNILRSGTPLSKKAGRV